VKGAEIMKVIPVFVAVCLVPQAAFSADPVMSGPLAGYFFDKEARAVRPVLGVPGSAYVAGAVLDDVDALAVSPDGRQALVSQGNSLALLGRLPDGSFDAVGIGDSARADKLAWSADGAAAVAYSSAAASAQVLAHGKISRAVDLSALEEVSALAIDNEGDRLLIGAADGLYLAVKGEDVRRIAAIAGPAAIAIEGADAFVAAGSVFEVKDYAGAAVAVRLDLDFTPTMLSRLGSETTFALNSGAAGVEPLYVIDAAREPAVFFVPAGREQ
jgi:hypothetical protein